MIGYLCAANLINRLLVNLKLGINLIEAVALIVAF
jgi:hypothetical protein